MLDEQVCTAARFSGQRKWEGEEAFSFLEVVVFEK